jgi:hypothetical protein
MQCFTTFVKSYLPSTAKEREENELPCFMSHKYGILHLYHILLQYDQQLRDPIGNDFKSDIELAFIGYSTQYLKCSFFNPLSIISLCICIFLRIFLIENESFSKLLAKIFPHISWISFIEQWRKDLMILSSRVRISLWDVGAGPSDETV